MRRRTRFRSPVRSGTASLTAPLGHLADGGNDVGIRGAPADVADDRAGAALSLVAALLRAGQAEMLAQRVEQRGARVEIDDVALSVDREPYLLARRHRSFRRRLGQRRWSSECQRRDPGCLEEKP